MAKAKRKRRARAKTKRTPRTSILASLESFLATIAPDVVRRLTSAERRADEAERKYGIIRDKLVSLMSPDQIDAAKIAGCSPEVYALEYLELWKDHLFPRTAGAFRPLSALKTF